MRSKLRELQRELRTKTRGAGRAKDSDAVVVNPTHIAVALQYVRGRMDAPRVLAAGRGKLAERIVAIAKAHRVPVIENRQLARLLIQEGQIDGPIPEAAYPQVAHIMAWVLGMRDKLTQGRVVSC